MILGFRSTVTNAAVNFGYNGDDNFAKRKFPIWALASEKNNANRHYNLLNSPLFIPTRQQLAFSFKNTINGVNFADNGQLEILLRPVERLCKSSTDF